MAASKISLYSLADLKNTSDDAIPNYLKSLKFKQSHVLSDVRLALGFISLLLAVASFYWDYKLGFDSTKYYTAAVVVVYGILNGILALWAWGVEKGKIYVGTSPDGDKIEISSSTQKHVPMYNLTITYYTSDKPSMPTTVKISRSFTQWFDATGHFVPLPFQEMFAQEIPIIGKADPRRASRGHEKVVQTELGDQEGLQAAMDQILAGKGTGVNLDDMRASTTPRKSAKNRRKA